MNVRLVLPSSLLLTASAIGQVAPPGWSVEAWNAWHPEVRWVRYVADLETGSTDARRQAWMKFLAAAKDYELLEWLALYGHDPRFGGVNPSPLGLLAQADAPQWMRVAAWMTRNAGERAKGNFDVLAAKNPDTHFQDEALTLIIDHGALFLTWLEANPTGPNADLKWLVEKLRDRHEPSGEASDYLPPLEPAVVLLQWLEAPPELGRLDPDDTFEPRRRYVHQVVRAIRGAIGSGVRSDLIVKKLLRLARHPEEDVRRDAYLGMSQLEPQWLPWRDLAAVARGAGGESQQSDADRRLAAMAVTQTVHPAAFAFLLDSLKDPAAPEFDVATVRLGELGYGYARQRLMEVASRDGAPESASAAVRKLLNRLAAMDDASAGRAAPVIVWRAVWLDHVRHPDAAAYRDWARSWLTGLEGKMQARAFKGLDEAIGSRGKLFGDDAEALQRAFEALSNSLRH